jgi:hypothetical protein
MKYKVYKIEKPGCDKVYIGITETTIRGRKAAHRFDLKRNSHRDLYQWFTLECDLVLLEETNDINREKYWIDFYGDKVVNEKLNVSRTNGIKNKAYNAWITKIGRRAKKEGLSTKDYQIKYNEWWLEDKKHKK